MKRAWPVVVFLAVAAGAAWFALRPSDRAAIVGEGRDDGAAPTRGARPGELAAGPASARKVRASGVSQLSGTVRRGGVPTRAQIGAHWLMALDPSPYQRRTSELARRRMERLFEASPSAQDAAGTARAGDDGRFVLDGLAPGLYDVRATTDDGATGTRRAMIEADGACVEADIEITVGGESLAGRVIHADGTPWSGIVVVEQGDGWASPGLGRWSVATRSDATGAFEAKGLTAGDVTVAAVEPGVFYARSASVAVPTASPFVWIFDAGLTRLRGRVVADADGRPIEGASITGRPFTRFTTRATSGADGTFELRVPSGSPANVVVAADGYAPATWQGDGAKPGDLIEVRLLKSARVVGRVSRAGAVPVAGATVRAITLREALFVADPAPAISGADGRYELVGVPPGDLMVVAEAKGLVTKGVGDVDPKRPGYNPLAIPVKAGETTTADIEMVAGASATGIVTDAAGVPVRGAVVQAVPSERGATNVFPDGEIGNGTGVTDANGAFVVDPLVPGRSYVLFADAAGYARCRSDAVTVSEAAPVVVALRFPPARTAEITVLDDATGVGVAGARVTVYGKNERHGGLFDASPTRLTDADGRTRVGPLEAGDLGIVVQADDYAQTYDPTSTTLVANATSLVLRIPKGLPVAGKVRMPDGSPAEGAVVQTEWDFRSARREVRPVQSGADGAFHLRGVPAGPAKLVALLPRSGETYIGHATTTGGAEDVTITLENPGQVASSATDLFALEVRVLGPDGKPVPVADALYVSSEGSSAALMNDGRASVRRRASTVGTIYVSRARSHSGTVLDLAPAKRTVRAEETEIEIRLAHGVSIMGAVHGPDGAGLKGVLVSVRPASRDATVPTYVRGGADYFETARTDATGAFRIHGLADEEYTLDVQAPAAYTPYDGPSVRGGASSVDVALKTGLTALVTIVDETGTPVAGARVIVTETRRTGRRDGKRAPNTMPTSATSDAAGLARLVGLPVEGILEIKVLAPETSGWSQSPWAPADTVVHLERIYTITGVARDSAGSPIPSASVHWSADKSRWGEMRARTDGRFQIEYLPPGELYLYASIDGPHLNDDAERDFMRVRAGAKDIVLVVQVGLTLTIRFENWPTDAPDWQRPHLAIEGASTRSFDGNLPTPVPLNGVVTFIGLRADETYHLFASLEGGLCASVTGLKAGVETRVRLSPGKSITGRIVLPSGAEQVIVRVDEPWALVQGKVEADGRYVIAGLPEGTFEVQAFCQKDGARWMASAKGTAGGTLDLEPKKP